MRSCQLSRWAFCRVPVQFPASPSPLKRFDSSSIDAFLFSVSELGLFSPRAASSSVQASPFAVSGVGLLDLV